MNNRQTLHLLMVLCLLALLGRMWATHDCAKWEQALTIHKAKDKVIFETADDLSYRRTKFDIAEDDQGFLTHFQKQAHTARMGSVTTKPKERAKSGYIDKTFTIEFEKDDPRFARQQIENFLYNAEGQVPRMRTTSLTMRPATDSKRSRAIPTGAEREDRWKLSNLVFTQRSPKAK